MSKDTDKKDELLQQWLDKVHFGSCCSDEEEEEKEIKSVPKSHKTEESQDIE